MNVTQLSLFIENQPGHLQNVLRILANENINITTLTIAEINDFGILRLIVNNPEKAAAALKNAGVAFSKTEVLGLEIGNEPGSLCRAIETFSKEKINIEYMYAFTQKVDDKAVMIFRFEDIDAAKKAATKAGLKIVKNEDITGA